MTVMRLRYVETVDFRKSELTCWLEIAKRRPALARRLKTDDVVTLASMSGDQLVFLHGFSEVDGKQVLRSTRLRLRGGRWNPLMLANYAKDAGIALSGLRTYEQHLAEVVARVEAAFRKAA